MIADRVRSDSRRLRENLGLVALVSGGYLVGIGVAVVASIVIVPLVQAMLLAVLSSTGAVWLDGGLGTVIFLLSAAAFPVTFAGWVVGTDLLLIRRRTDPSVRDPNRTGLLAWKVAATLGFAVLLLPFALVFSSLVVRIGLFSPVPVILAVLGSAVVAGAVSGTVGHSIPLALAVDGPPFRTAVSDAAQMTRHRPRTVAVTVGVLLTGWLLGVVVLVAGVAVFLFALGLWIFGVILLPVALALIAGSTLPMAAGHVGYRLRTLDATDVGP